MSIFKDSDTRSVKMDDVTIIDDDWISKRFMVPDKDFEPIDKEYRYWSSADSKFTDTTLGGNLAINARPQFTPYADIRRIGRNTIRNKVSVNNRTGNIGMGRYYSEAFDDTTELVYLEFGLPRFNSIFDFFSKSVDYVDSVVANTGRSPAGYRLGQLGGGAIMLVAFPVLTITIWLTKKIVGLITTHGAFNYYYMEPSMHTYWASVNTIVTQMATELGILIPSLMNDTAKEDKIGVSYEIDQDQLDVIKELMPGVIGDNNYIDIFAIATKAQTLANRQMLRDRELFESKQPNLGGMLGYLKNKFAVTDDGTPGGSLMDAINSTVSFTNFIKKVTTDPKMPYSESVADDVDINVDTTEPKKDTSITNDDIKKARLLKDDKGRYQNNKDTSSLVKFSEALDSSVREGGAFAIFAVDYSGSVSESFSNSVGEIDTGNTLKSLSKKSRDVKFNLSGGNILGDTITTAVGYLKDTVMGALDSVTFGASNVIQTLLGGGYIDMPKKWEDSSASLPQINYKIQLISPYGNVISQLQNIYIPIAMLLAGTLPQAVGRASYTSPFLCSLFNKGKQNIEMGMITSLTITRGTSNLAFSRNKRALAIDVSFTVTDFSNIMAAPVNSSIFNIFSPDLQDDTLFSKYIATLASRDLLTSKYAVPKARLKASRAIMGYEQTFSSASLGMISGSFLKGILGSFAAYPSAANQYQNN